MGQLNCKVLLFLTWISHSMGSIPIHRMVHFYFKVFYLSVFCFALLLQMVVVVFFLVKNHKFHTNG